MKLFASPLLALVALSLSSVISCKLQEDVNGELQSTNNLVKRCDGCRHHHHHEEEKNEAVNEVKVQPEDSHEHSGCGCGHHHDEEEVPEFVNVEAQPLHYDANTNIQPPHVPVFVPFSETEETGTHDNSWNKHEIQPLHNGANTNIQPETVPVSSPFAGTEETVKIDNNWNKYEDYQSHEEEEENYAELNETEFDQQTPVAASSETEQSDPTLKKVVVHEEIIKPTTLTSQSFSPRIQLHNNQVSIHSEDSPSKNLYPSQHSHNHYHNYANLGSATPEQVRSNQSPKEFSLHQNKEEGKKDIPSSKDCKLEKMVKKNIEEITYYYRY